MGLQSPDKINILFVMVQMDMGGSEKLVHNLAKHLDRKYFNPSLAWFFGDKILQEFQSLDIPLYHVPKIKRVDFSTMRNLGRVVKKNNIHIVNGHHFMSLIYSYYGCKFFRSRKLVCTFHSEWEVDVIPPRWTQIGRFCLRRSENAIGVSPAVTDLVQSKFDLEDGKAVTIRNGVDLDAFSNLLEKNEAKQKLGWDTDLKYIGIVANFKKVKNHIFLLNTFNKLTKINDRIRLVLVGQGFKDDPDNTEKIIDDFISSENLPDKILKLGYRQDIPDILNALDIFCLTSIKEGLPISLIEAMAAGLPVVATNVDGIRGVINHGENGFLVEPGNDDKFSQILNEILRDDAQSRSLGEESRKLATNAYRLDRCVDEYQELAMKLVKERNEITLSI